MDGSHWRYCGLRVGLMIAGKAYQYRITVCLAAIVVFTLSACGPPIRHMVRPGESLYSIGFRYGLDYRDIAEWNDLSPPYRLKDGQWVRLAPVTKAWWEEAEGQTAMVQSSSLSSSQAATRVSPKSNSTRESAKSNNYKIPQQEIESDVQWRWPTSGEIIERFSGDGNKGINIAGARGQPILAAAEGEVVYSGSGLVGLGKLIIIKHNKTYLSAYAHNDLLLVQEGTKVVQGQQIATMGSTGIERVMLHFEIRRNGKPVDPLRFLTRS